MMKKRLLIQLVLFFVSFQLFSQSKTSKKYSEKGMVTFDYLSINMPTRATGLPEADMGFAGIHYNVQLNSYLYGGFGFYGAVSGERGGFFTLGANLGVKKYFTNKLFLDAGLHFGGGGGASAPDGGGAFILPHVDLGYQFKQLSLSAGYSYVNFFDKGNIVSDQLHIGVSIPISFDYGLFNSLEQKLLVTELKSSEWNQLAKRISILLQVNNLYPFGDSKFTDGASLIGKIIRLAGFEFNFYVSNHWFSFFKADGAFSGIRGGYMDLVVGGGYQFNLIKNNTNIVTKFGIGAGGGGGVDTQGGFYINPEIALEQKIVDNLFASLSTGVLMNPDAHFASKTFGLGLKYYVDYQGIFDNENSVFTKAKFKGIQMILGQEMYLNAGRMASLDEDLHQISLQANMFLTKHLYLAGQTSFANFGNAGAYAEGIVGFGYNTSSFLSNKMDVFAQVLGGAAGGGGIGTGQGLIVKPTVGLNFVLTDKLKLRASVGKVKAYQGNLNSTSLSLGLNYNISFLTVK